jgi:transposase
MEVIHPVIAGLDVHQETVVASLRAQAKRGIKRDLKIFGTTTRDLLDLQAWLVEKGCPMVVMESTGVYWKPVFNILEGSVEVVLANAYQVKTLPGRKTDMRDAEWLADLGAHGLVRPSFIPPAPIRELRELTRYRKVLIRERTSEVNRIQKLLETANIKLGCVVSDITGVSALAMLRAMVGGARDPVLLADMAKATLRKKRDQLVPALDGRFLDRHGFILGRMLDHMDYLNRQIDEISREVERLCVPFDEAVTLLTTIPGVGPLTAQVILSEIGADMSRFPSAHHLASWAGVCPGNNESAGKRRTGRTRKGNRWLATALSEAAWAAARTKGTYLQSLFRRLAFAKGKGKKKASVALSHSILIAAWHILHGHLPYQDLGPEHFGHRDENRTKTLHIKRLESLGFRVTLEPISAA